MHIRHQSIKVASLDCAEENLYFPFVDLYFKNSQQCEHVRILGFYSVYVLFFKTTMGRKLIYQ